MTNPVDVRHNVPLTTLQRHLYASGHFGISLMAYVIAQWVVKFYFPNTEGATSLVPVALVPLMMVIGRVTDGINDPLIGYMSDNARTRWGRRKPFMVIGIPLTCAFFLLLWHPPSSRESLENFMFASGVLVIFFVGLTLYAAPYLALLPEIARSREERVKLAGLQGIYNVCGLIAGGFVTGAALSGGLGYQGMALVVTAISLVAFALPICGAADDPSRAREQAAPRLVQSIISTLGNRPFRIYVVSKFLFLLGLLLLVAALPYMVESLLHVADAEAGILTGLALLSGVLCVPLILRMVRSRGVKAVYLFSMRWFALMAPLLAFMALLGGHSWGLWAARALVLVCSVAIGGLFALPYAILADVTDHDRQRTGIERQAMFFCVQGLILKAAYSGAPAVVTGLLVLLPAHSAGVLTLIGPLAGLLALGAYAVFRAFPEEEVQQAAAEMRAQ